MAKSSIYTTLFLLVLGACGCNMEGRHLRYHAVKRQIEVDGDASDWMDAKGNVVQGSDHLWFGQGLIPEKWQGNEDHSFCWKAAWFDNKLYFLIEVTDDNLQPCIRECSWLNDCVEILLDYKNREGQRIEGVVTSTPLEERLGKNLRGYELHFLPCSPPRIYISDVKAIYRLENAQNEMFYNEWDGQAEIKQTNIGYVMEVGFRVPGLELKPDMVMGVDVAVGDDDGNERKSLMLWTGKQVDFWITMDNYGKMILVE